MTISSAPNGWQGRQGGFFNRNSKGGVMEKYSEGDTMNSKIKVFLGGTCNGSRWRDRLISYGLEIDYFNPVVEDWTPDCMVEEIRQRKICDIVLYTVTPKMTGVYAIAELVDDSNKRPERTVFVRLRNDGPERFDDGQWKSLGAVHQMVARNGAKVFTDLKSASNYLNDLARRDLCR
jgi:hypothetical protein